MDINDFWSPFKALGFKAFPLVQNVTKEDAIVAALNTLEYQKQVATITKGFTGTSEIEDCVEFVRGFVAGAVALKLTEQMLPRDVEISIMQLITMILLLTRQNVDILTGGDLAHEMAKRPFAGNIYID